MRVEVRPISNLKKWHNKSGKESFTQPKTVEALYDKETGRYATGLTEEEARDYSLKLGGVPLDDKFDPEIPHPTWSGKAFWVYLQNATMIFDTTKPLDFVKVKLLKSPSGKWVANSQTELDEGKWPEATHVIYDEAEEINVKASKISLRNKAIELTSKLGVEAKATLIMVLSPTKYVRGASPNTIEVEMNDLIETKAEELVKTMSRNSEDVATEAKILEALYKNILTKEATGIYYMGTLVALDMEQAIKWFKEPNNQTLKIAIMEKLISPKTK